MSKKDDIDKISKIFNTDFYNIAIIIKLLKIEDVLYNKFMDEFFGSYLMIQLLDKIKEFFGCIIDLTIYKIKKLYENNKQYYNLLSQKIIENNINILLQFKLFYDDNNFYEKTKELKDIQLLD